MPTTTARMSVLTVGSLVQVQVHGVTLCLNSTEAWDLGGLLCDAAAEADDAPPIDWEAACQGKLVLGPAGGGG